jgi:hypothetical protein
VRAHVSAEAMARYAQGDLGQRRMSQIATHLSGCERCRALGEDLSGVTALLASAPPPPMPEHLASRISGVLAAEAARRAAGPAGDVAPAPRRSRRRAGLPHTGRAVALRGLAAAAAAAVVAGGVYEVAVRAGSAPSGSTAAGAPAAQPATRAPDNGVLAPALPAYGPTLRYRHAGRQASITPVRTGTDFTPAGLSGQATSEVARYNAAFAGSGPDDRSAGSNVLPGGHSATFGSIPVSALRGCVNRVAGGNLVLLVDVARYRGTPATVIVTAEAAANRPVQIWVVGTGCSASRSDVLAHTTGTRP